MIGAKLSGQSNQIPLFDFAASYSHSDMTCSVIAYDLFSRVDMDLCYRIDKHMSVATPCAVDVDSGKCPDFELGLKFEPDRYTTLRAKISDKGILSGCFKVAANERMTMYGSLSVGKGKGIQLR